MKIVQINAIGQGLSTGRTCSELQAYINQNTKHTCYTAFAQGAEDQYSIKIGGRFDWKLHGLFSRVFGKQAYFSCRSTKKLLKKLDNINPDVVVLRNLHGNYINLPMLLKYLAKNNIATVTVLHDCWFYTGKCTHYTVDKCYKWQTGCSNCPRLKKDNPSWFFDKTEKMYNDKKALFSAIENLSVVGVSDWITKEAEKSFLNTAKNIIRIYNAVDLNTFSPQNSGETLREEYNLTNKKVVLGVASGWSNAKGLDIFNSVAKALGDGYIVALVGQMPEEAVLADNVINIPPTKSVEELAKLYSMANVFVTTSLEESFGKVSAEALACGTPIVCFDSTANKELVGEGCGYCVAPKDLDAMVAAITNICVLPKENFTAVCRAYAQENFDKEKNIKQYISLFEKVSHKEL